MIKTTQVAADRAYDETKTVLPAEVARGVYIENPPSAEALKLMHLLISHAGGRMADDTQHELRMADIKAVKGMRNHSRETLRTLFVELKAAVLVYDDTEAQCEIIGGFMDEIRLDYRHEVSDDLLVKWYFGRTFRRMAEDSCHWAILDRQTVFALSSKYSILLFQHIASLVNLEHVTSKTFTVPELRVMMGVPEGKMTRFADFRRFALEAAIAEINHTSRLTLTSIPNKIGRSVASITIGWQVKEDPTEAKRELDRHRVGRGARRSGTAETVAVTFPHSGGVKYTTPWEQIAQANCNWDHTKIAEAFRSFCQQRNIRLDAKTIEKIFAEFCAKQPRI